MSGKKQMSEINKLKWNRMRHILEKLRGQPMTFEQSLKSLQEVRFVKDDSIGKRSVQNYLAELCAIGIVSYDRSSRIYAFAENEKQVFESKHDYQIALVHSKNLLFSNDGENTQRFNDMDSYLAVDVLVYESERNADDFATLQHLKTGYPDIYELLRKYRRLMDETGLSKRTCLPKLGGGMDFDIDRHFLEFDEGLPKRPSKEPVPASLPATIDDGIIEFWSGTLGRDDVVARVQASKVKEILDLRDILVGRIYGHLMNAVRHGTPLKGRCDFCPNREVTIK